MDDQEAPGYTCIPPIGECLGATTDGKHHSTQLAGIRHLRSFLRLCGADVQANNCPRTVRPQRRCHPQTPDRCGHGAGQDLILQDDEARHQRMVNIRGLNFTDIRDWSKTQGPLSRSRAHCTSFCYGQRCPNRVAVREACYNTNKNLYFNARRSA